MKINGWRRLAIVLSSLWILGSASLAVYENFNHPEYSIAWFKFLTIGVILPFGLWGILEIMVFVSNWVLRGFRK
jgi:hypothetical protein